MTAKPLRDFKVDDAALFERAVAGAQVVRRHGVEVASLDNSLPTPERLGHDPFVMAQTYRDKERRIVARALDTRDRLFREGVIDLDQARTWQAFNARFHAAALDPLRAANLMRAPGGDGASDSVLDARDRVRHAMVQLGAKPAGLGHLGSAIWWICGVELSMREFARRWQWGNHGLIDPRAACGLVVAGLTVLSTRR